MPRKSKRWSYHVALLVESSRAYGRAVLQGVAQYAEKRPDWILHFEPSGLEAGLPCWLRSWQGDGILARVTTPHMAKALQATGLPVVDLRGFRLEGPFPCVLADNTCIAQRAFDHLYSCGLRHFAFCGSLRGQHPRLDQRGDEFQRCAVEAGFDCEAIYVWERQCNNRSTWGRLIAWLKRLPKPTGILACNDDCGFQVLTACRHAGIGVPEELAILGVDNDPVLCNLSRPSLSSIDLNGLQIGYEAAGLLDRLMQGRKPPAEPVLVTPGNVIARGSTGVLTFTEPEVTAAVRFIREHACEGIRVRNVVERSFLSQRQLERLFQHYLGRSLKAELLRIQIEKAQQLLAETDLPVKTIAIRTGFRSEQYFSEAFFRQCGLRPTVYRQHHCASPEPLCSRG
jgi:LacI family transcriptional regulator